MSDHDSERLDYIDIVFDGPPSHESGRFIEVEDASGKSIRLGEWVHRSDGYWALRFASKERELREARLRAEIAEAERDNDNKIAEVLARENRHRQERDAALAELREAQELCEALREGIEHAADDRDAAMRESETAQAEVESLRATLRQIAQDAGAAPASVIKHLAIGALSEPHPTPTPSGEPPEGAREQAAQDATVLLASPPAPADLPEIITVSDEEWEHFIGVMNSPAEPTPMLRELLSNPSPWDKPTDLVERATVVDDEIRVSLKFDEEVLVDYTSNSFNRFLLEKKRDIINAGLASVRDEERERCALVADSFTCGGCGMDGKAGAAIRTLSDQPQTESDASQGLDGYEFSWV